MINRAIILGYILLCCVFSTICCTAQTIQNYSGPYENLEKSSLDPYGNAAYSYYQEDNKRIFHGKFLYRDKHTSLNGSFSNNKQDGEWVYRKNGILLSTIIRATFRNGIMDGPISIKIIDSKTSKIKGFVNANVKNNVIVGEISALPHSSMDGVNNSVYFMPYLHTTTGAFSDSGRPIGTWTTKDKITELNESFLEDGSWNTCFINTSTGDTINDNIERRPELPNIIIRIINQALNKLIMRDTKEINIEEIKFEVSPTTVKAVNDKMQTRIKNMFRN